MPEVGPDVCAAIASYDGPEPEPGAAESIVMVQLRTRSTTSPAPGQDLADQIAGVLLGRWPVTLPGGVQVLRIAQTSGAPLGRDGAGRWDYVINFELLCYRPTTYRR